MKSFIAIMNTPGYLPWSDDEPPVFDSASDAWAYLAAERREQEEALDPLTEGDTPNPFSETVDQLDAYAASGYGAGTVYGDTPGYEGPHDLGIAYSVLESES